MVSFNDRLHSAEKLFDAIASALLAAMMLLVVADVGGRHLFNRPVQGALELTEFFMVAIVFFSFAHKQAIKAHIRVELLDGVISHSKKLRLGLVSYILGLVVFSLMTWQGWMSFVDSWKIREATDGLIRFPIYPAKLAIPLGCFLLSLRFLADVIDTVRDLGGKDAP